MRKFIYTLVILAFVSSVSAQWQSDVRLTNDTATSYTSTNNARNIASYGDYLHVVWYDNRDGNEEIYYKRSTNAGLNWSNDIRLTNNSASSQSPSIALNQMIVHVVWSEFRDGNYEIYYKKSPDGGITWEADTRITNNPGVSTFPSIAVVGSVVHVVWRDNRQNLEIYYNRSTNDGLTWGTDLRLTQDASLSQIPSISASGPFVCIVWMDNRNGNYEIYYKFSPDAGIGWSPDTRLTSDVNDSWYATLFVTGQNVSVFWSDNRTGNYEIFYKKSTDGGINWGTDTQITNALGSSFAPTVSINGVIINLLWQDDRDGNFEIYYKQSTNGGLNWGNDIRLTNNSAPSYYVSSTVSDIALHIVWYDSKDGNNEIYYKKNPNANLLPPSSAPSLIYPSNNSTNLQPNLLLDWTSVQYAASYRIQIASDSLFASMVFDTSNVNRDSLRVRLGLLIANTKYFWRVNATNAAGTGPWSTVWNFRISPTGIISCVGEIPKEFNLYNNYPNPFNPTTKIKFDVARLGDVKIAVYDVMGREVQTLVNETMKPGTYEATFDASQLTSGVYFYKLITGDFVETKRMLLVK